MIYVTGDLHGDISRFSSKEIRKLKKGDTLIVCGDFGFLWNGSKKEKKQLKWIGKRPYHVLFVEGTHDNLDLLQEYPTAEWQGGMVHEISGNLRHLIRGHVFQIENSKIFAFGGGASDEIDIRRESNTWWGDELPSETELEQAWTRLAGYDNRVDYIVTHECSRKIRQFLSMDHNDANILDTFFDNIRDTLNYKRWFFGCVHLNKLIPPADMALFQAVVSIQDERPFF